MELCTKIELSVVVLLIACAARHCSAQCTPAPPSGLTVPPIITTLSYADKFRPKVSGRGTNWWAVFSETQVRQYGLWCQVQSQDNMGMGDDIGDWYYPSGDTTTPDGLSLLPTSDPSNAIPYQSLKCTNQVGLALDGDVTSNQGIVKCNTTITGLERQTNYFVVYSDSVYSNYNGPIMDTTMVYTLLSCRSAGEPILYTLSFTVSYGPPSQVICFFDNIKEIHYITREDPLGLSREVIRSRYVNSSYPDMTRVTLTLTTPRVSRSYTCTVNVEGRVNIDNNNYNFFHMGSGTVTVNVTVAGTPTNVTANRIGYDSARVFWTAPSTGTPTASYEVFYQLTAGGDSTLSLGNTSSTELMLTELAVGNYSIFVVGFGAEREPVLPSDRSETTTVTIDIPQMPPPLNLVPNSSSVMVSWSPTLFAPVIYRISYSCQLMCSSSVTQQTAIMVDGVSTAHELTVTPSSNCTVSVTAVFGTGSSSNTVTSSIITSSAAPTGAPGGLTNSSVESRSLSVVWGTVLCPQQRGPITGYRLRYSNETFTENSIAGEGSRQHVLTGLTPYTSYSVQVAAVNNGGTGPYSTPLTVETLQDVPGPVSGLSADPGVVHVDISWNPPMEPNGVIVNYEVGFSNGTGVLNYISTVHTRYTLTNVPPNSIVAFSVRAYTVIGPGKALFNTVSTTDIPSISAVSVVHMNSTSVWVTWTPLNLPVVDHYTVHYSIVNGGSGRQTDSGSVTFPASVSSGVVSGLLGGQQYQFSVSVTLSVGGQTFTGSPTTTVTDLPAPTSCSMGPEVASSSTLVYTVGVGVVSALLLLSLMGYVVYTIVVCTLMRKQKRHLLGLKYQTQSDAAVRYTLPALPAKDGNVEWKSNESYGVSSNPAAMKDSDSIYEDIASKPSDRNIDLKGNESYGTSHSQATEDTGSQHVEETSYI